MQEQIKILWDIQTLRQQRSQLIASKKNLNSDEIRRLWHQINLLKQSVAADKESLFCLEKVCSRQEADLEQVTLLYEENEAKLGSGEITDSRELDIIRQRCECVKSDIIQRESEKTAGTSQCEKLMVNIIKQEQMISDRKQEHSRKQRQLAQALTVIDEKIYELDESCKHLLTKVETALMDRYRELEKQLATPVTRLENGQCSVCSQPFTTEQKLEGDVQIIPCSGCGRIILFGNC